MAQGLDVASWTSGPQPAAEPSSEPAKKSRVMGSRRIFPPQFKLLVLDSYRNDVDCRGNQRATARKYNIHRRQIQKWLQCEQHLRSSVEGEGKGEKRQEAFGGGEVMALNRSATIQARLGDASEKHLTLVGGRQETKVMAHESTHSRLKLVAQKLYPRSVVNVALDLTEQSSLPVPSECLFNETPNRIRHALTSVNAVNTPNKLNIVIANQSDPENLSSNKINISSSDLSKAALLKENTEGQKFCNVNVEPESLVQKYTDHSDGAKFFVVRTEKAPLLYPRVTEAESSSLESSEARSSVGSVACANSSPFTAMPPASPERAPLSPSSASSTCSTSRSGRSSVEDISSEIDSATSTISGKSFTPKRKWMQESLQELRGWREVPSTPVLPPKQRVKMHLRSPTPIPKSDFSIERLCSPTVSPQPEWPRNAMGPVGYNYNPLPFPPPLLLQHRAIPDLVSLHFKPEILEPKVDLCNSPPEFSMFDGMVPCKEECASDSDDNSEVDVLSTTPVEKKTFDLSGYHNGKRRSFSVQFKLSVLNAFYNDKDCNKNQRATARKFNINRRQVQKWLSQENDLRSEELAKGGKYLQRHRVELCMQCPQHCSKRRKLEKTIEVNVKPCADEQCLSPGCLSGASECGCGATDNSVPVFQEPALGWPPGTIPVYPSALSVPTVRYMSWYNFDIRHEKETIY